MAGLFQVLWGQPDGSFKQAEVLKGTDDEPLIIPADSNSITENICTRPTAADWDADGDLDLIVGNFAGSFYVFTGEGEGRFLPKPDKIMTDHGPLKIQGVHSDPFPIDWDHDGDLDVVSGSSNGGVQWAENVACAGKAASFTGFRDLIMPHGNKRRGEQLSEDDLTGPSGSTRVWVDDVNSDGKLDVLVGDTVLLVALPDDLTKEESDRKQAQWQEEIAKASELYREAQASDDQNKLREAREKMVALNGRRSEFISEDRTGFVWLYLQK